MIDELVLSEVHVGSDPGRSTGCTVFSICVPGKNDEQRLSSRECIEAEDELSSCNEAQEMHGDMSKKKIALGLDREVKEDETGDLDVPRKRTQQEGPGLGKADDRFVIHHSLATALPDVGLQVWRGALLLADYFLHEEFTSGRFKGATALELGAGTGLAGIVLARTAKRVYITDRGEDVLDMCLRNVTNNASKGHVAVRELDWFEFSPLIDVGAQQADAEPSDSLGDASASAKESRFLPRSQAQSLSLFSKGESRKEPVCEVDSYENRAGERLSPSLASQSKGTYHWTPEELEDLRHVTVLLAADVIYDDALTDAVFDCVRNLLSVGCPKVVLLAVEKRYNFSLDERAVVANGYSNLKAKFDDVSSYEGGFGCRAGSTGRLRGKLVPLDQIPQYLHPYERGPDLELWELWRPDKVRPCQVLDTKQQARRRHFHNPDQRSSVEDRRFALLRQPILPIQR